MSEPRVLVVDDEEGPREAIRMILKPRHQVFTAGSGEEVLAALPGLRPDVIFMDVKMPRMDGVQLLERVKAIDPGVEVVMITAYASLDTVQRAMRFGAMDYLVKPFAFAELMARLGALARRPPLSDVKTTLEVADLKMDLLKREVRRAGKRIELQPQEFKLLEYMLRNKGRVVTRTMLLENVWDFHFDPQTSVVETHVSRLRAKIDRGFDRELIETVRGAGYCIRNEKAA